MVNEVATCQIMVSDVELEYFNEREEREEYVKHQLYHKMSDFLIEQCHDLVESKKEQYGTMYKLQLAVLTPQRYRELLKKEAQLERKLYG